MTTVNELYKIIAISDSHFDGRKIVQILPLINECNYVIHLGDGSRDLRALKHLIKAHIICIKGNCDIDNFPSELVLPMGDVNFFLTHGSSYHVKQSLQNLSLKAISQNCEYVLYGHSHVAGVNILNDVQLINPGSISPISPSGSSYAVIAGDGTTFFTKIISI